MKKSLAMLCASMLVCGFAFTADARHDPNYDPFADEQKVVEKVDSEVTEKKMTMSERLATINAGNNKKQDVKLMQSSVLPGHLYIPKGTKLKVKLINDATSKKQKKNEIIPFEMAENLIINNVVIIPQGKQGIGYVYEAQKAAGFGRKGVLRIAGEEITTINGIKVPLKKGLQGKGKTDGGAVAVAAVVSLAGGIFMKGSNVDYKAGTQFEVEVMEDVDLQATPENLAEVMDPNRPQGQNLVVSVR